MDYGQTINAIVSGALGGGAVGGMASFIFKNWWLERLKTRYSAELETYKSKLDADLKGLQSVLDHRIFVSKAHYETEFESMKTVFGSATKAFVLIQGVRPMFGYGIPDETKESKLERLSLRVLELASAHDEFILQSESLLPFYPENLRVAFSECAIAIRKEIGDVRTSGPDSLHRGGYVNASLNQEAFQKNYYLAANIIRERIERLAILR
jgi:hypothetical protein